MSVILECTISSAGFQLGEVLSAPEGMEFELERVVPMGEAVAPFVWVVGEDRSAFEERVRSRPEVKELHVLDTLENKGLYRIEWEDSPTDLVDAIVAAGGSVLQGRGNGDWEFRLRFPDHEKLSAFYTDVTGRGLPVTIDRTYTPGESGDTPQRFGLTDEQREALLLALERGYFATPREVQLETIADELDISRQALSNRIRRGNENVLRAALLGSAEDSDSNT